MADFYRIKYVIPSDVDGNSFVATTVNDNISSQDDAGILMYALKEHIFYKYIDIPDRLVLADTPTIEFYLYKFSQVAPIALYVDFLMQVPDPPPIALINSEYIGMDLYSVTAIMAIPVTIPIEFHKYIPDLGASGSINSMQVKIMTQLVAKVYTESFFLNDLKIALGL